MTRIAHLSDLHFGRASEETAEELLEDLQRMQPKRILISGDLTQRAKKREFAQARRYLERLPAPWLVVPGNHDIPLYNLWQRFALPLARYKQAITPDLNPVAEDQETAVMGINTARSLTLKNGRISYWQMARIRQYFCDVDDDKFKILVTHHPFLAPTGQDGGVGRYRRTLAAIAPCKVDLLLAGHFHMSYQEGAHDVYPAQAPSILILQAGTAISQRTRGEPNAYNLLEVSKGRVELEVRVHRQGAFVAQSRERFIKQEGRWRVMASLPDAGEWHAWL
jgi:3',5'-cyclic AMP phosphodiesterase CpdA